MIRHTNKYRGKQTRWVVKPGRLAAMLLLAIVLFAGCGQEAPQPPGTQSVKPVVVRTLVEETRDVTLDYLGLVSTEDTRKYSFKTGGKIARIPVSKGDTVLAGAELAVMDTQELQLGVDAATAQLSAARAQYQKAVNGAQPQDVENARLNVQKAEDARNYTADLLAKTQTLYSQGAAAKAELDQIQLELDVRESELQQARQILSQVQSGARREDVRALVAQVEQAQANLNLQTRSLEDAVLLADADGTVLEVLHTEGELVGAGYPVVVMGTDVRTITTGVTAPDSRVVKPGMKAWVGEGTLSAEVLRVSDVPDLATLTYEVELGLSSAAITDGAGQGTLTAGNVVEVRFVTGRRTGIWVPLTAISVEGERHVFLARDGVAVRAPVTLLETRGMLVLVEGLSSGDQLILEGTHRLVEGDRLAVEQEEAET